MDKDRLANPRLRTSAAFMRIAHTPGSRVNLADAQLEVISHSFVGSESKEYASEVQVLNLHPVRDEAMTGLKRRGGKLRGLGRGSISPKSIDELYWMLPGAIPENESCSFASY
ncbi:uncharacterized protein [Procambarus clarkii]|uniref:uncharacterized protein n=1 Tax=Procambarus clarkii TaxID=6728 RepID=UPI0037449ED9